jgi:hypothetical protein
MSLSGVESESESPRSLTLRTLDVSGAISIRPLDVSGIEQSGLHLSTFFDSLKGPSAFTRVSDCQEYPGISGPLPPVLLNRFDKLSQSLYPEFAEPQSVRRSQYPLELPPSPKETPNSPSPNSLYVSEVSEVETQTVETQAVETQSVETQVSEVQGSETKETGTQAVETQTVETQVSEVQVTVETQATETQVSVETQATETQTSVDVKDAVVQTLVGENRLEVPRLR